MSLKLTPSESRTLNRFADLSAQKRVIQAELTPVQKELRELQVEVKAIIKAKGTQLPITSIKQRANIELSTTRSHLAYTESFVEGYYVNDNMREILKASAIK